MRHLLFCASVFAILGASSHVAASNVSPELTLARRGSALLTTDGGRSVAVTFASPISAGVLAELRARGVAIAPSPLVTGAYVATVDDDAALDALARDPRVTRIEAAAPALRPLDAAVIEGTGVGPAFRSALGTTGHWLDGTGLTIADVDSDVFVFHPSLFRADAGAFAWIDVDGDGAFRPGVDAVDLDRDGAAGEGEVATLLRMELRSTTFTPIAEPDGFDATRDYVYLDTNGSGRRDYGEGFTEDTPAFGEPLFVPDDVNGNGKLDPGERLLRLGTTKLAKINAAGVVYERGAKKRNGIVDYGKALIADLGAARAPEHGTYMTAIIAGGNGSNRYRGLAPGADLVVVTTPDLGSLDWLVREPKIAAVSMPIGSWYGALDGSSELDAMVDALWSRGVVTSVSVGNSGSGLGHGTVTLAPGVETEVVFHGNFGSTDAVLNVVTRAPGATLDVTLADAAGTALMIGSAGETSKRGTTYQMVWTKQPSAIGKVHAKITMRGATAPATAHVFVVGTYGQELELEAGASRSTTIGSPATADTNLAATGWVVHTGKDYGTLDPVGSLVSFASRGPRIDGHELSGLAAPVNPIAATLVSDALDRVAVRPWPGTSCSSPQIAAAAALVRQNDPSLTAESIRSKLLAGARREGALDPNEWGAGKLDVRAAMGLPPISKSPPAIAIDVVDGATRRLRIATASTSGLSARWDFDYDGAWDTEWAPLADVDAPEAGGAVRVAVHDEAGNVVGATATLARAQPPPAAAPAPPTDRSGPEDDGGCTVGRPASSRSHRLGLALAGAIAWIQRRRRRR